MERIPADKHSFSLYLWLYLAWLLLLLFFLGLIAGDFTIVIKISLTQIF